MTNSYAMPTIFRYNYSKHVAPGRGGLPANYAGS